MACYVDKVIATAIGEIGYKETGKNITKYAAYFDKYYPDFYNTKKQGAEYCDIFVDYCVMVNSDSEAEAEYVLCQPKKSCGAGCSFSYDYYKEKGRTGKEPKLGAQVFFGTGKKPTHTGLVVELIGDSFVTVEGNSDNMVKRHTYKNTSSKVFGFGYPRYSEQPAEKPVEPPTVPSKSVHEIAEEVIAGKWGNGTERKTRLKEAGYNPDEVQAEVNRILYGKTTSSEPDEQQNRTYTVKKGDTLWQISQKYLGKGSRYKEIKALNGLKSDIIRIGQVLKLPAK